MTGRRILMAWSSGKDSAWALHVLRQHADAEVIGLLTTFNENSDRVAMHAVRRALVDAQAHTLGLPLVGVPLPWPCSNAQYETVMRQALAHASVELSITHVAFGDLFLADIREYREQQMATINLAPMFPLWGLVTGELAQEMIDAGLQAIITTVDPKQLAHEFAGRHFDAELLKDLPDSVDPCGERGEFHTFAYAGPMFDEPIKVVAGDTTARDGFVFCDVQLSG